MRCACQAHSLAVVMVRCARYATMLKVPLVVVVWVQMLVVQSTQCCLRDIGHQTIITNPLTSCSSTIETATLCSRPQVQQKQAADSQYEVQSFPHHVF